MNVLVAVGDPALQHEVATGLYQTGFSVIEVRRPGPAFCVLDDDAMPPGNLDAAVVGYDFGFDGLAFGAVLRERHPCLGVVYVVSNPWMPGRTRTLDSHCERTVLSPRPGQQFFISVLARVLGQIGGLAHGALTTGKQKQWTDR